MRFYASDMILNIHSDASYLSVKDARSRAGGHFFLGKRWKRYQIEWIHLHTLHSSEIHSIFSSRGRIRCTVPKDQIMKDHQTHLRRTRLSTTSNTNSLWQRNSIRNCKWYCENTSVKINGDEIFLCMWPGEEKDIQCSIPSRLRDIGRLPKQTSQWSTSHPCEATVCAYEELPKVFTNDNEA